MDDKTLVLAVIGAGVFLGWDVDSQALTMRFATYVTEGTAASQRIYGQELEQAFADTKAPSAEWFVGKACWVDASDPSIIRYVRMFKR